MSLVWCILATFGFIVGMLLLILLCTSDMELKDDGEK
jgi:hypothetical protein